MLTSGIRTWLSLAAIGQPTVWAQVAISAPPSSPPWRHRPAGMGLLEAIAVASLPPSMCRGAAVAEAPSIGGSQIGLLFCAPFTGLRWHQVTGRVRASGADADGAAEESIEDDDVATRVPSGP